MLKNELKIPRWEDLPNLDLYMDQLLYYVDSTIGKSLEEIGCAPLTASMVNNYVKAKIIQAPVRKKYNKTAVAMVFVVYLLKTCYSTDEIRKLIEMGLALGETGDIYDRFCASMEGAVRSVFSGEISYREDAYPDRPRKYLMDNFALTFASKFYVQKIFLLQ